eukprot:542402_1
MEATCDAYGTLHHFARVSVNGTSHKMRVCYSSNISGILRFGLEILKVEEEESRLYCGRSIVCLIPLYFKSKGRKLSQRPYCSVHRPFGQKRSEAIFTNGK